MADHHANDREVTFLTIEDVIRIHEDQIDRYGGASEIRDTGLLESAVAQPQSGFGDQYLHKTIFQMAAAYLYHITMNHPFADGNKRTGAMSAYVFLALNGYEVDAEESEFEDLVRRTASGQVEKQELADFLEKRSHRMTG
jgi:death-on-curing protein